MAQQAETAAAAVTLDGGQGEKAKINRIILFTFEAYLSFLLRVIPAPLRFRRPKESESP